MKIKLLFAVALLNFSGFVFAATNGTTQVELNQRAGKDLSLTEAELNDVLAHIKKEYADDPIFLEKLGEAQKAWEAFRDKEIEAIFPPREDGFYGSIHSMCYSNEKKEISQQRIRELKRWTEHTNKECSESMEHPVLDQSPQPNGPAGANSERR